MPPKLLPPDEIKKKIERLPGWELQDKEIQKRFRFDDFLSAIDFVNRIAPIAEAADHHPDIVINYNKVLLKLTTHSAGGLTGNDFNLAQEIEKVKPK